METLVITEATRNRALEAALENVRLRLTEIEIDRRDADALLVEIDRALDGPAMHAPVEDWPARSKTPTLSEDFATLRRHGYQFDEAKLRASLDVKFCRTLEIISSEHNRRGRLLSGYDDDAARAHFEQAGAAHRLFRSLDRAIRGAA